MVKADRRSHAWCQHTQVKKVLDIGTRRTNRGDNLLSNVGMSVFAQKLVIVVSSNVEQSLESWINVRCQCHRRIVGECNAPR
mgnify:CR=1 FL=1